jgi:hypothetical protein
LHLLCDKRPEGGDLPLLTLRFYVQLFRVASGGGKTTPQAPTLVLICRDYFGLAQKAKTVIWITNNRDERHLPCL